VSNASQDPADFAVPAFLQHDLQQRLRLVSPQDHHAFHVRLAFGQIEALSELLNGLGRRFANDRGAVGLLHAEFWMREHLCQITIVGDQDEPGAGFVEASHREEAIRFFHEIDNASPSPGVA
jgi:hypothetical protein